MQFPYYYTPVAGTYSPAERDAMFAKIQNADTPGNLASYNGVLALIPPLLVHDDTLPSGTTAFRKSVFAVNPEWAICVGLYAQNVNNDWYQMTPDQFTVTPLIHKRDLRFTLASSGVTSFGGQPFKAVIFYKLPAASLLSQEVQG